MRACSSKHAGTHPALPIPPAATPRLTPLDPAHFRAHPQALLVTNPNNPLGTIYSDATIREMLAWCLDNRVHYVRCSERAGRGWPQQQQWEGLGTTVGRGRHEGLAAAACLLMHMAAAPFLPPCSDEIYALSVFKQQARFTSAILLAQQLVGEDASASAATGAAAAASGEAAAQGAPIDSAANGSSAAAADEAAAATAPSEAAAVAAVAGLSLADGGSGSGSDGYSQQQVDSYVHLMYGLSKDWCASGLRVGVLYSRNQRLQQVGGCSGCGAGRVGSVTAGASWGCLLCCLGRLGRPEATKPAHYQFCRCGFLSPSPLLLLLSRGLPAARP